MPISKELSKLLPKKQSKMNYGAESLVGAAAIAAITCYPVKTEDSHIAGAGIYRYEAPAVLITARSNYASGVSGVFQVTKQLERNIESEFPALAKQWKEETGFHSSLSEKFMHPAYQRIMAMG